MLIRCKWVCEHGIGHGHDGDGLYGLKERREGLLVDWSRVSGRHGCSESRVRKGDKGVVSKVDGAVISCRRQQDFLQYVRQGFGQVKVDGAVLGGYVAEPVLDGPAVGA